MYSVLKIEYKLDTIFQKENDCRMIDFLWLMKHLDGLLELTMNVMIE